MSLHHKICPTLGGTFNLPHAETHTIILPHALAYNAPRIPKVMSQLAGVLPGNDGNAINGWNLLLERLEVKRGLAEFRMKEEDIESAADAACTVQYSNPRGWERDKTQELIRRCWAGEPARADL